MATLSSHILDTVSGKPAAGIRVQLFVLDGDQKRQLFDVNADGEGRVVESIDTSATPAATEYELVVHGAQYYDRAPGPGPGNSVVKVVVLRFSMPDPGGRHHMPIMLSPHSYSVWWSK
jgi:5-hydroxyisourate hydrolase